MSGSQTFDRIEQSLQVKWGEAVWDGLALSAPAGWTAKEGGRGGAIEGPRRGEHPTIILLKREDAVEGPPPETARPGPKLRFLGEPRDTLVDEREIEGEPQRMLLFNAGGWTVAVRMLWYCPSPPDIRATLTVPAGTCSTTKVPSGLTGWGSAPLRGPIMPGAPTTLVKIMAPGGRRPSLDRTRPSTRPPWVRTTRTSAGPRAESTSTPVTWAGA